MAPKRIDPLKNSCKITLEVPWDAAQAIVDYLVPALDQLVEVTNYRQRQAEQKEAETRRSAAQLEKRKAEFFLHGRRFHQAIKQNQRNGFTAEYAVGLIALDAGLSKPDVMIYVRSYRQKVKTAWRLRRERRVLALSGDGLTQLEIAKRLGSHQSAISRILINQRKKNSLVVIEPAEVQK